MKKINLTKINFSVSRFLGGKRIFGSLALFLFASLFYPQKSFAVSVFDARERGVFNIGASKGELNQSFDQALKKDVLKFDYTLPKGTVVGVWTKGYPVQLKASAAKEIRINVKVKNSDQAREISAAVEIKGTKEIQTVPVKLESSWKSITESVDWDKIGFLKEVVLVVNPKESSKVVSGTLFFDLDFINQTAASISKSSDKTQTSSSLGLFNAREKGVFNIGASKGELNKSFDQTLKKDVLKFNYKVPKGTAVGIWTKSYPRELERDMIDAVKIGVKATKPNQTNKISVTMELKGSKEVQAIPVKLQPGWNHVQELMDWNKIGNFKEAVFVVNPVSDEKSVDGMLYFDLEFVKRTAPARVSVSTVSAEMIPGSFGILDAVESGVFNIGASEGKIEKIFDETLGKDLLKFDYSAPAGTFVGVWTKDYSLVSGTVTANTAKIAVKVPDAGQAGQISMAVEVKGEKNLQKIPLQIQSGWNFFQESVDWNSIGNLKEVVFVVNSIGGAKTTTGSLYFDLNFVKQIPQPKKNSSAGKNVGLAFAAGVIMALMLALLNRSFGKRIVDVHPDSARDRRKKETAEDSVFLNLKRDILYGITAVLIAGVSFYIYYLGNISSSEAGLRVLIMGLTGALVAELLKYGITEKHLTPVEIFQNIFLTGLLAATSSEQTLWQAPAAWTQLLMKSNLTAMLVCIIYHGLNACSLSSSGKHLSVISGILIVGTPYLFGWLLVLERVSLLQNLSAIVTGTVFSAHPAFLEFLGRFIIVFIFNEAVANGIGIAAKGKIVRSSKAHTVIFFISFWVVVSPLIADFGSSLAVASLPPLFISMITVLTAMFSQAGLWGETYLITGMILDGTHSIAPSKESVSNHVVTGMTKGMAYSGIVVTILYALNMMIHASLSRFVMAASPLGVGLISGVLVFPLIKAIIETFDGSMSFFKRARYSYGNAVLYARGAVVGLGVAYAITQGLFHLETSNRILFGLGVGLLASVGVSLLRDIVNSAKHCGRVLTWKIYFVDALMGGFIGSAVAFYLDYSQVAVVVEKFRLYNSVGLSPKDYTIYPLLSKWGRIDLGSFTGGVKLLFNEVLAGVISWSVAAWLFAINRAFMEAYFQKDKAPIKFLFSKNGFLELIKHMIQVLRWGLWMAPIINTFLRMMGEATWYNQDGAIRTLVAMVHNFTMNPAEFQAWSLKIFVSLLAYDFFRILIWIDHMGLRVATLVNLSFIGMNRLDDKIARFIGPAAAQRYIPEAVKRFTTWAPLLIPFYIPRGEAWDYAWNSSQAIQNSSHSCQLIPAMQSLAIHHVMFLMGAAVLVCAVISFTVRSLVRKSSRQRERTFELGNREYHIVIKENGAGHSCVLGKGYDISRRSYDTLDPCGRILYLVDADQKNGNGARSWPVIGNFPIEKFETSRIEKGDHALKILNVSNGVKTIVDITIPEQDATAEIWTVTVENLENKPRAIKAVPYLEWVIDRADADRGHTQYARLFPEMEYLHKINAVLAWQRNTKSFGILASEIQPDGFLTSRVDFIGRARSVWSPRVLDTLNFLDAKDAFAYPTFDPIGSLMVSINLDPGASKTVRFMIGYAKSKEIALELTQKYLKPQQSGNAVPSSKDQKRSPLIGHGEIVPGTPQPYSEYADNGNKLLVHTPYTPRPYDHALSNGLGHFVMVTNRGLHTTANGNSQQNRITPDWPDTVAKEVPAEAIYLYDPDHNEWYSPTHHPLNDHEAKNVSEFGVDGTAVFRMTRGTVSTELTVFVPPHETMGVYILTVKNNAIHPIKMRMASYFQIVLAGQPEWSGPLEVQYDKELDALFCENPRNTFRTGPVFASISIPSDRTETKRGRFFGTGRGTAHPFMVEKGEPDSTQKSDTRPVAALLGTMEIPARGEATVVIVLGQTDNHKRAAELINKYKEVEDARKSLENTRKWWLDLMGTLQVKTNIPEFDQFQNWLKYQAIAERIWARRGFYQTSGAFGFRDQLQDSVNLIWVDPALARKQIILHASQQFIEGDVVHWFHTMHDGRTAFSNRSHASDNLLWLAWGIAEYVKATDDNSILDEMTSYLEAENPFLPLPKMKHGWGTIYLRSARQDTVYRHGMKSVDLVLEKRMGEHGLPLIGTGDWNDGLDEIGSKGKGESVWLGFFLHYILKQMLDIIEMKEGSTRKKYYIKKMKELEDALENTWREDRYLRAIHDDGTEIGVKNSGIWEIDALTAAWAVMSGINFERGVTVFNTALQVLEKENVILLGWPALREDTKPYLGRSSHYPEGVRENGMYCHGVQWLIKAARIISEQFKQQGDHSKAEKYRETAVRLWMKISPLSHVTPSEIEIYGGQPNKQAADMLTTYDQGRMIWHGYTGAAGWMLRQAFEGVIGASLVKNELFLPKDFNEPRGNLKINSIYRNISLSSLKSKEN